MRIAPQWIGLFWRSVGAHHHHHAMMDRHLLLLALLDDDWQPCRLIPLEPDWRGTFGRLLDAESRWLALIQQRPVDASTTPRPDDIMLTRMLARRLRPLEMTLADHVIHAGKARFSFRAAGLL